MPLYVWSELIIVFFWFLLVPQGIGVTHWLSTSQDLTAIDFNRQKGFATKIIKTSLWVLINSLVMFQPISPVKTFFNQAGHGC